MKKSEEHKIRGIIIDNKLNFKSHVKNLCKRDSQNILELTRLSRYLNDKILMLLLSYSMDVLLKTDQ